MQVIVKGRNFHVSPALKELATRKVEKVKRFFDRIQTLEVEFSEEHNPRIADKYSCEVTLTTKKHVLRAEGAGPDAASALDAVVARLENQVKRLKGKILGRGHQRTSIRKNVANGARDQALPDLDDLSELTQRNGSPLPIESSDEPEAGDGGGAHISRVKRFAIKPMTAQEAVLQMESLGHDFYLFVNAESEQAGVVYRRRDGTFGLIEPS